MIHEKINFLKSLPEDKRVFSSFVLFLISTDFLFRFCKPVFSIAWQTI